MKKSFIILIGVSIVLLLALIVIVSSMQNFRSTPGDQPPGQNLIPTSAVGSSSQFQRIPASALEEEKAITTLAQSLLPVLPIDEDGVEIGYSDILDTFYLSTDRDDEVLERILAKHGLLETYRSSPSKFKKVTGSVSKKIMDDEEVYLNAAGDTDEEVSPTVAVSDDQAKQLQALGGLVQTFFDYSPPSPTPTPIPTAVIPGPSSASGNQGTTGGNSYNTYKVELGVSQATIDSIKSTGMKVVGAMVLGGYKNRNIAYDRSNIAYPGCNFLGTQPAGAMAHHWQPGAKELQLLVEKIWFINDKTPGHGYIEVCKPGGVNTNRGSIHGEGRAVDSYFFATVPDQLKKGNIALGWMVANAEKIGVQYAKYWRVQWSPGNGFTCVTDPANQKNHATHLHFELNWAGSLRKTPHFNGSPAKNDVIAINQEMCPKLY